VFRLTDSLRCSPSKAVPRTGLSRLHNRGLQQGRVSTASMVGEAVRVRLLPALQERNMCKAQQPAA